MYIDGTQHGASVRFSCSLNIAPSLLLSTGVYGFLHVHAYFCLYTGGAPLPFKVRRYVQYLFRGFILIGAFRFSSLYAFFQRVVRTRPSFVMDASFIGEDGEEEGKIDEFI